MWFIMSIFAIVCEDAPPAVSPGVLHRRASENSFLLVPSNFSIWTVLFPFINGILLLNLVRPPPPAPWQISSVILLTGSASLIPAGSPPPLLLQRSPLRAGVKLFYISFGLRDKLLKGGVNLILFRPELCTL